MDTLYNVNQAAYILKVHPLTLRRYIREGKLKAGKVGGNIRIKESELANFNRDYTPREKEEGPKYKLFFAKTFNIDDPLFKLKGRGASLYQ